MIYKETIVKNGNAHLTIKTFSNGNHAMQQCITGGLFENLSESNWKTCDGYYETMLTWLRENGFGK